MKKAPKQTKPEPMLPPTFVLVASFGLIGALSQIEPQDDELERAAQLVAPVITRNGLFSGDTDLIAVAVEESIRVAPYTPKKITASHDPEGELHDLRMEAARIGVHVGLAAGYLLTQFIAGKDGAR